MSISNSSRESSFFAAVRLLGRMAALRHAAATLAALALGACARDARAQEPSTLWQLSPAAGIRHTVYDSVGTVGDLRRHGNQGLGTAARMNGEMVVLDGVFYRVDASGVAYKVPDSQAVTFGIITWWRGGTPLTVVPGLRYCFGCPNVTASDTTFQDSMNTRLLGRFGTLNWFYALRLEGTFDMVVTRSFAEQNPPYQCWDTLVAQEPTRTFTNVRGTMVGFKEPAFVDGGTSLTSSATSIAGFHLHFLTDSVITDTLTGTVIADSVVHMGGHVISFTTRDTMQLQAAPLMNFELRVPNTPEYNSADLTAPPAVLCRTSWRGLPASREQGDQVSRVAGRRLQAEGGRDPENVREYVRR